MSKAKPELVHPDEEQVETYEQSHPLVTLPAGSPKTQAMSARHIEEVRAQIVVAKQFPRNEEELRVKALAACKRSTFADKALYSFRKGEAVIEGPTIRMAETLSRLWTNIRSGGDVVSDTSKSRTVLCWAWDLQTNVRTDMEIAFEKVVYRRQTKNKPAGWYKANERDVFEMTNRNIAKGRRNCIIQTLPWELVDECIAAVKATQEGAIRKDPKTHLQVVIGTFATMGVSSEELEAFAGKPLGELSAREQRWLSGLALAIEQGETTWSNQVQKLAKQQDVDGAPESAKTLRSMIEERAARAQRRGDDQPRLG